MHARSSLSCVPDEEVINVTTRVGLSTWRQSVVESACGQCGEFGGGILDVLVTACLRARHAWMLACTLRNDRMDGKTVVGWLAVTFVLTAVAHLHVDVSYQTMIAEVGREKFRDPQVTIAKDSFEWLIVACHYVYTCGHERVAYMSCIVLPPRGP